MEGERKKGLKEIKTSLLLIGVLVPLIGMMVYQIYQINIIHSEIRSIKTIVLARNQGVSLQKIIEEILPEGTPEYGEKAGVSFDNPERSLKMLVNYHFNISLSGEDLRRYLKIATTPDTACEYCCGVGDMGFGRSDGSLNCGCSHNIAFSGLTKWLIKNTDYTDEQIVQEIKKWKKIFFPRGAAMEELRRRGISPESMGLPAMVGGC